MSWLVPPTELTPEQQRAVQLSPKENRAIVGGPGSGKTQILLHRARYLCDSLHISPDRFMIFVYTNSLKDYIKQALRDLQIPEENVITVDQWCRLYYQENIGGRTPWDKENKCPDFEAIRRAVIQKAKAFPPAYDFVMVDEGQDLTDDAIDLLKAISHHVTVCFDNKQQIYEGRTNEGAILRKLGIRKRNINLIEAFRVCPYLVEVAAQLIADPLEREAFKNQTRQPQTERQTPLIYYAAGWEDEREQLYEVVRERQLKNERIGILLPQKRQVYGFAKGLSEVGIEVEVPAARGRGGDHFPHDFGSSRAKLMSIHSAKGLTFDSVLLPRLVSKSFSGISDADRIRRLLFVAVTRATKWCYFSTNADRPLAVLDDCVAHLKENKRISILDSEGVRNAGAPDVLPEPETDLDFL